MMYGVVNQNIEIHFLGVNLDCSDNLLLQLKYGI
jgi:hypothetical protein